MINLSSLYKESSQFHFFSQIVYITWRYTLLAKKRRLSSVNPRPQLALNLTSRVAATWTHGTLSGTKNGWRPHSANALSHNIVAQAWGSWFPCTITTTGKDGAHTYDKLRLRGLAICFYNHQRLRDRNLPDNNFLQHFQLETLTKITMQTSHPLPTLFLSFRLSWSFLETCYENWPTTDQ